MTNPLNIIFDGFGVW